MPSVRYLVLMDDEYIASYTHSEPAYRHAKALAQEFKERHIDAVPAWSRPEKDPLV